MDTNLTHLVVQTIFIIDNNIECVPHFLISETLIRNHLPPNIIQYFNSCYSHSQAVVETARWRSNPFPFRRGVFQGDPISPIIFLMVFNPILQDLKLEEERIGFKVGDTHHVTLPYADDFCLLTTNLRTHQKMINRINSNITSMGMKLKPSKCRGFSVCSGRASDISFHIGDNVIPSIRDEEQKFLGKLLFFSGKQEDNLSLIETTFKEGMDRIQKSEVRSEYKL